jgi:hypothetical protein
VVTQFAATGVTSTALVATTSMMWPSSDGWPLRQLLAWTRIPRTRRRIRSADLHRSS